MCERWHPASETPEIPDGEGHRFIVCRDLFAGGQVVFEAFYLNRCIVSETSVLDNVEYDRLTGWHIIRERDGEEYWESIDGLTHWQRMPEPPTPEEEARRALEEETRSKMAAFILMLKGIGLLNTEPYDIELLREWAAKGGRS